MKLVRPNRDVQEIQDTDKRLSVSYSSCPSLLVFDHQLEAGHDTETLLCLVSCALHSAYRGVGFVLWFYLHVEDLSIQASTGAFQIIFTLKLSFLNLVVPPRWLQGKAPA